MISPIELPPIDLTRHRNAYKYMVDCRSVLGIATEEDSFVIDHNPSGECDSIGVVSADSKLKWMLWQNHKRTYQFRFVFGADGIDKSKASEITTEALMSYMVNKDIFYTTIESHHQDIFEWFLWNPDWMR